MPNPRHELGWRGEEAVARWLATRGWRIEARRWRSRAGELDLVCWEPGGVLVAVEVKLRSSPRAGTAPEAVDGRRIRRLRHALAEYASQASVPSIGLRLDLITLTREGSRWRLVHIRGVDAW